MFGVLIIYIVRGFRFVSEIPLVDEGPLYARLLWFGFGVESTSVMHIWPLPKVLLTYDGSPLCSWIIVSSLGSARTYIVL